MDTANFFDTFYQNAKYNGVLILNEQGTILNVNNAFKMHFGYDETDLKGKNFCMLFTLKDQEKRKPELELETVKTEKSANDENYIVNKDGNNIWVTGESVLVENEKSENYIVKVIHNIHAQKQLERFLLQTHEFIENIFDSISDAGLLMLDTSIRVKNTNKAFLKLFNLKQPVKENSRLSEINNAFFQRADVKQNVVNFLVSNEANEVKTFEFDNENGEKKKISFQGKLLEATRQAERKLLIFIKEID